MLLKLTHLTDLTYDASIAESVVELRMFPRQEAQQHRLSFELKLQPYSTVNSYFDWLGNTVHTFTINGVHDSIKIAATSVVETEKVTVMPETLPDTWPMRTGADYQLWDYLQFTGPVVDSPQLAELAKELYARPGIRIGELGQRMIRLINTRFDYEPGATTSASPVTEMLVKRKGVCQDYTHLMIALARSMKIPARYVSGLLHPDDTDVYRFRGYTQTHAWCELHFPSFGWIGFDPTNSCVAGENYVKVAVGRDYHDVPPNKGLFRGAGKESILVSVNTTPLTSIPNDLFPEKIMPMGVATSNGAQLPFLRQQQGGYQQAQSQQQQGNNYALQIAAGSAYHTQQQQQQQSPERGGWRRVPFGPWPMRVR
ncbi:MAG TPA: transglutaminase family protein [Tepidisphaeraceae bacterium]|jgi:transglutaminase-like putative cysteine protease